MGEKYDEGKLRYSLVPPRSLHEVARVLTYGANKYSAHSWKTVPNGEERYLDALIRHLEAYRLGELYDTESKMPHLAHVIANAMFLMELDLDQVEADVWLDDLDKEY